MEVSDKTSAIKKGNERWEIARESGTKGDSEVKVAEKVTDDGDQPENKAGAQTGAKISPNPAAEKK
jgi:hypothetical protein